MKLLATLLMISCSWSLLAQVELDQELKLLQTPQENDLTKLLGRNSDDIVSEVEINHFIINYFLGLPNGIVTLVEAGESFDNLIAAGATTDDILNSGLFGPCDGTFDIDSDDPIEAARAIGLCHSLVSAEWVSPDGSPPANDPDFDIGHGIKEQFGTNVNQTEGEQFLILSTGTARDPADPGYQADYDKGYVNNYPAGFPYNHPSCGPSDQPQDGIGLKVVLDVPSFATVLSFDYRFYTHDFPNWLCALNNDQPIVSFSPDPGGTNPAGNVLIDANGHPVNVNSQDVITFCDPGLTGYACASGLNDLIGTGFDTEGGSEWITINVPVVGNTTIEVIFAIWDARDGVLASSILIDNARWGAN